MEHYVHFDGEEFEGLPSILDVEAVGKLLGISRSAAYNLFAHPDFPSFSVGGRKMIIRGNFLNWLDQAHIK